MSPLARATTPVHPRVADWDAKAVMQTSPGFVAVGQVSMSQGVLGDLRVVVSSSYPERFAPGQILYLKNHPYRIQRASRQGATVVVKLEGIDSMPESRRLRGAVVAVPESEVPSPPDGQYYYFQIIDMDVYTVHDEYLGRVYEILNTHANDVYVVRQGRQEVLIPALSNVVVKVDLGRRRITVALPEGLR